jgi:tripartite-type tricarboxylate transporter receptor subunit TctC
MKKLFNIAALACLAALVSAQPGLAATDYPTKPIRFIVPFAPGGSTDIVARVIGENLSQSLGQPVVIDNRSGAGGNIGADLVAKATPDGYTMLMGTTGIMSINGSLYRSLPYDASKDFEAVIMAVSITNLLAVNPSVPAKSVQELIALAKSKPRDLTFASSGAGSSTHLSGELFKSMARVDITHIPYRGSGQALADLLGGQVTMIFDNMPSVLPHVKSGKLRPLAVTSLERSPVLPDVPTVSEAGVSGYESKSWSGVVVPAKTPKEIIQKLNAEIVKIFARPEVKEKLAGLGADPVGGPPEHFAAHIKAEREKWSKVVQEAGIKVD